MGYDAISLRSGWDEYGIAYSRPTENVHIRNVCLRAASGSSISFGREMSGGIYDVVVDIVLIHNSLTGIAFRTTKGRGGYNKGIDISNTHTVIVANGSFGSHPDDKYDANIGVVWRLFGIRESPFSSVASNDVSLSINSSSAVSSWQCSYVYGSSKSVTPEPCPELKRVNNAFGRATV